MFRGGVLGAIAAHLRDLHGDQAGWWFAEFICLPAVAAEPAVPLGQRDTWLPDQVG